MTGELLTKSFSSGEEEFEKSSLNFNKITNWPGDIKTFGFPNSERLSPKWRFGLVNAVMWWSAATIGSFLLQDPLAHRFAGRYVIISQICEKEDVTKSVKTQSAPTFRYFHVSKCLHSA